MKISWLIFAIIASSTAHADNPCDDPATATTIGANQCEDSNYQAANKKLNAAYQAALHRIGAELTSTKQQEEIKQELSEAQQLWTQFRDKDCGALYNLARYGAKTEIRDAMYSACMIERTNQRANELDWFGLRD